MSQKPDEIDPVEARHHEIENADVKRCLLHIGKRFDRIGKADHLMKRGMTDQHGQQRAIGQTVVNNDHSHGLSLCGPSQGVEADRRPAVLADPLIFKSTDLS